MVAFYLYLGLLAVMTIYTLITGLKTRELETFVTCIISFALLGAIIALKAFGLYALLLAFFVFSGMILIAVSDLGLMFMNPTPWKKLIKDFPTYTGIVGLIALLAATELWMEYDQYWGLFQLLFGGMMTISFITAFIRVVRWSKSGVIITLALVFAAILYFVSKQGYFDINQYLFYWLVSVAIQSVILSIWRCAVRLDLTRLPERTD